MAGFELDLVEVKHLWWWLQDGGTQSPDGRGTLRRAWGFCPRHAWGFAAVEGELRARPCSTTNLGWLAGQRCEQPKRLDRLFASMTRRGPTVTAWEWTAWVEAMGWFTGWGIAVIVAGDSVVGGGR